jgi:hypothetical protein
MTASTITKTSKISAVHGRSRLRAREERAEKLTKGSLPSIKDAHNTVQAPCHSNVEENKAHLLKLYSSSAEAKIWCVASNALQQSLPPTLFPEYTAPGGVSYIYRSLDFWTSGFFPGSLHLLLERERKYANVLRPAAEAPRGLPHVLKLE